MSRLPLLPLLPIAALALVAVAVRPAGAQQGAAAVRGVVVTDSAALDLALARARRQATEGDLAGARGLLDSLERVAPAGAARLGEVLFWRATFARTAADAERDYRRVIVEHPSSPRTEDALLRLAQLEMARGDQELAVRHLERLVLEHPTSANRARARYWMGRAHLDAGDAAKACGALGQAMAEAAPGDAELRGQVRAAAQPCPAGWERAGGSVAAGAAVVGPPPDSNVAPPAAPAATPAARPASSAPVPATPPVAPAPAASTRTVWTVQLAAFDTRGEAESLVRRLAQRGVGARVATDAAPFRVRTGRFATRGEAVRELEVLKGKGLAGFVASETAGAAR